MADDASVTELISAEAIAMRLFIFRALSGLALVLIGASASATCAFAPVTASSAEDPFLAENNAAMTKMMRGMSIKPSGDVDRDFVDMMVPHHQGAIDMAIAVLRYGKNEKIRRIAQEIIVTQQEEIAAMRRAVGETPPPSAASPTQVPPMSSAMKMQGAEP